MQLDFTVDQEELRASVRAVLERECAIDDVRALVDARVRGEAEPDVGERLWRTAGTLDWPALTVPEAAGGIGLGVIELAVMAEELGRVLAPGPLAPTLSQFVPAVRESATTQQAARWLAPVATGECTGTLAVAEGDSDVASATAVGDEFVLTGRKRHVVEGACVDEIVVAAQSPEGVTLFVVSRAEVRVEPVRVLDATRGLATIVLDGVRVGPDRVLGEVGGSASALARAVEQATVAQALDIVGCCQTIFDTTLAYARERVQFGVPIGSFQAVKHKLADMFVALERARSTAYFAAACIEEDDSRREVATSMAKAAAGDCQRKVGSDGIQLLGGIGYTWEHDQHLYVKRAKAGDALFGTAAEHRAKVADIVLGAAVST